MNIDEGMKQVHKESQDLLIKIVNALNRAARVGQVQMGDIEDIAEAVPTATLSAFNIGVEVVTDGVLEKWGHPKGKRK